MFLLMLLFFFSFFLVGGVCNVWNVWKELEFQIEEGIKVYYRVSLQILQISTLLSPLKPQGLDRQNSIHFSKNSFAHLPVVDPIPTVDLF